MFLATAPTGVLTAGSRCLAYLRENEGVAPLQELLFTDEIQLFKP